jgi:hypothetical protein
MKNETQGQMVLDVTLVPGLPRAIEDWRVARCEFQMWPTRETLGLYAEATDQLEWAFRGDCVAEPGSRASFEQFRLGLIEQESD